MSVKRTIDITLVNNGGVSIETEPQAEPTRKVCVCLHKEGFKPELDGTDRSIRVSFGALPSDVHWDDIKDKPDLAEPMYWKEM